jgi:hypothetical protein
VVNTLHEQLLAAIEAADSHCAAEECRARDLHRKLWRAVVELHAPPTEPGRTSPCEGCGWEYPCDTVRAVAEQLGVGPSEC